MEAVILMGVPASGKSTFYQRNFRDTHVRLNGDMLRSKGLEWDIIKACLKHRRPFVIDKMNFSRAHRQPYIKAAKVARFSVVGYFIDCSRADALRRNQNSDRKNKNIPNVAIHNAFSKLDWPKLSEGFDKLFYVTMDEDKRQFSVLPWSEL